MTAAPLPDPLVASDVDLRDFGYMPLDALRLRDSELAVEAKPEVFRASVLLWCASWHQVPAGSLPTKDAVLGDMAKSASSWKRIRAAVLAEWVSCSDGRLYHPVVAEKAREAWAAKQARVARTAKATAARAAKQTDPPPDPPPPDRHGGRDGDADVQRDVARDVHQGKGREGKGEGREDVRAEGLRPSVDAGDADGRPRLELVGKPEAPKLAPCPHQELLALYRQHLPHLRQPMQWDGKRAEAMRARWQECSEPSAFGDGYRTQADGLAFWSRFFAYVAKTPKLRDGISSIEHGQARVWKPSLDWLMAKGNFLKVIEGAYA